MSTKAQDLRLRKIYKTTKVVFDFQVKEQGGGCAICGRKFPQFRAFQDHFHGCCPTKGKDKKTTFCGRCTRGVLCYLCNKFVVGYMEKQGIDPNKLAAYMNKWAAILKTRGVLMAPVKRKK